MDKPALAANIPAPLTADLEAATEEEQTTSQGVSRGAFITVSTIFGVLLLLILYIVSMTARRIHVDLLPTFPKKSEGRRRNHNQSQSSSSDDVRQAYSSSRLYERNDDGYAYRS